jgi:hypothetical protein
MAPGLSPISRHHDLIKGPQVFKPHPFSQPVAVFCDVNLIHMRPLVANLTERQMRTAILRPFLILRQVRRLHAHENTETLPGNISTIRCINADRILRMYKRCLPVFLCLVS